MSSSTKALVLGKDYNGVIHFISNVTATIGGYYASTLCSDDITGPYTGHSVHVTCVQCLANAMRS